MNAHNEQHDPASAVVKQNLTTQPAAAQEAVAWQWRSLRANTGWKDCTRAVYDVFRQNGLNYEVRKLYAAPVTAAPVEMSPEFTDTARAAIAWVLWHHQGASSPVGQPLRFALGMGAYEPLPDWRIAEAKRYAAWAGATTAKFHEARASTPAAPGIDLYPIRCALQYAAAAARENTHTEMAEGFDALIRKIDASPKGGSGCRYFCGGPEGHFFCDDLKLARDLVNAYDKGDDWTITDLQAGDAEVQP